jgi:hypothetical protein
VLQYPPSIAKLSVSYFLYVVLQYPPSISKLSVSFFLYESIATLVCRYITQLRFMVDIATALGHSDDAVRFADDEARSLDAFVSAYFRTRQGNSSVDGRSSTSNKIKNNFRESAASGSDAATNTVDAATASIIVSGTFGDGSLTQMAANALALNLFANDGNGNDQGGGSGYQVRVDRAHTLYLYVSVCGCVVPSSLPPPTTATTHTHTHTYTYIHTCTCTHTYTLTRTHAHARTHTQTLRPDQRHAAIASLVDAVITAGNHSDAGIISFSTLFPVMSSVVPRPGVRADPATLALAMNLKTDYPSFGYVRACPSVARPHPLCLRFVVCKLDSCAPYFNSCPCSQQPHARAQSRAMRTWLDISSSVFCRPGHFTRNNTRAPLARSHHINQQRPHGSDPRPSMTHVRSSYVQLYSVL